MIFDDDQLVALFNKMTNSKNPQDRVTLGREISNDFGRWLMCPSVLIEQLTNKLEQETNEMAEHQVQHPLVGALRDEAVPIARKIVALLQAFLTVRPQMRAELLKRFPAHDVPE